MSAKYLSTKFITACEFVMMTGSLPTFFSKISVESICDSAHISKRTFYRYFPDKYALLNETFRYCFFSRIEIADDDLIWDIFGKVCAQVYNDINMLLTLLEEWIRDGFTMPPDEFYEYIRGAFSVYGKWVYEVATDRPRSKFTMEKYLDKEW